MKYLLFILTIFVSLCCSSDNTKHSYTAELNKLDSIRHLAVSSSQATIDMNKFLFISIQNKKYINPDVLHKFKGAADLAYKMTLSTNETIKSTNWSPGFQKFTKESLIYQQNYLDLFSEDYNKLFEYIESTDPQDYDMKDLSFFHTRLLKIKQQEKVMIQLKEEL